MREDGRPTGTEPGGSGPLAPIGDAELAALALAADPDRPIDADAVPFDLYLGQTVNLLPEWYMSPVTARQGRRARRSRRVVILAIVGAFLVIEGAGLCSTYGQLPFH